MSNFFQIRKSQPSATEVHVDRPLTNLSQAWFQDPANFGSDSLFPVVNVSKKSDQYFNFSRADLMRSDADRRAIGAAANKSGFSVSTASFECVRDSIAFGIPDGLRENADAGLSIDRAAADYVSSQIQLVKEVRFAATAFVTGVWNASGTPGTTWDDAASDPIADVQTRQRTMMTNTGRAGNVMAIGLKVFHDLCRHPDILDRIKYMGGPVDPALVSLQALAAVFGVSEVRVLTASRNTAAEGAAGVYALVNNTRHALLLHRPSAPGLMVPSAGYTFVWQGGVTNKRWRDEEVESDIIEGNIWYTHVITSSVLGEMFINAVAA